MLVPPGGRPWVRTFAFALFLVAHTRVAARAADCAGALNTAAAIQTAMKNAAPGTTILIAAGTYRGLQSKSGEGKSHFYSGRSGTESNPIVLKSCDPARPAVLQGDSVSDDSYVLHLTGDHWVIQDVVITTGTKGIVLDHADHNLLRKVEVHTIGDEGVHIRDGSSWNVLDQAKIHDVGLVRPGYGEGVYVGSDSTAAYEHAVVGNVIRSTTFGSGIGAEPIDVKEGADGTIVEYCTFDGTGISGEHYSDSFVDVKGVNSVLHHNVGSRHGNPNIVDAFQVRVMPGVFPSGYYNVFHDNVMDLDNASGYLLRAMSGTSNTTAYANVRVGGGKLYGGIISTTLPLAVGDRPVPTALALAGFVPNPARRPDAIAFTLATRDDARLEVADIAGRRVFSTDVGPLGPGRHVLRAEAMPRLAPGVYLMSLVQAGERRTAQGVILR